jgi:CRISPR-associated Csx11 family protein
LATEELPPPTPRLDWLRQQWQGVKEKDICPVCGLRPQGRSDKAIRRKVCDVCERRRLNRSEQWLKDLSTTIWTDEVADDNGRLALIVARFGMTHWLSGDSFNTVLAFEPSIRQLKSRIDFDLDDLVSDIKVGLDHNQTFQSGTLLDKLVPEEWRGGSNAVKDFYDLYVSDTDLGTASETPNPELLALSLMRQFPSFARLRRVWETTRKFWEETQDAFKDTVGTLSPRLWLRGTFVPGKESPDTLGASHVYEIMLGTERLSIVCVKENEFLTADNLHRMARLLDAPEEYQKDYCTAAMYVRDRLLKGGLLEVQEPTGYGSPNKLRGKLRITDVTPEVTPYVPAIPILAEPRTFMALVPASKALDVAKAIKSKYETEMGKVRNRLPLTIGLVFASSRTPLAAILDAGRRMLKQSTNQEAWKIKKIEPPPPPFPQKRSIWPDEVGLLMEKDGQSLSMTVKTVMGDGRTEDVWYPYWQVEHDEVGNAPSGRTRQFTGPDGNQWVHVCDLQVGDEVCLMPSRFDFEFLDTAARRFEISYDKSKRRGTMKSARPYYLEQLDEIELLWRILCEGLATTQIKNLEGIIEAKRTEWAGQREEVFKQMVRDALTNANWRPGKRPAGDKFDKLHQAAVNGQLTDVVEVYMDILKLKCEADTVEVNQ